MNIGDPVRVLAPFDESFPGERQITDIVVSEDGSVAYLLGEAGGFDAAYLEPAS